MSDMTGLHVRSKIIKVPDANPGLIFINGQQKEFRIENMWKSPVAPAPNMNVDVDLDSNGTIVAVSQVPDAQIAREQAEVALKARRKKARNFGLRPSLRRGCPIWWPGFCSSFPGYSSRPPPCRVLMAASKNTRFGKCWDC